MGGCATKPKVLKAEMNIPLAPEESGTVSDVKIVAKSMVEIAVPRIDEVEGDHKVDDKEEQGSRRRSLSNLFKEAEDEGKESKESNETTETESKTKTNTLPKKVKEAEQPDTKTATVESEIETPEITKPATVESEIETPEITKPENPLATEELETKSATVESVTETLENTSPENPTEEPDAKSPTVETESLEIPKPENPTKEPRTKTAIVEPETETPVVAVPDIGETVPVVEAPEISETALVEAVPETETLKIDGTEDGCKEEEKKMEVSKIEGVGEKEEEGVLALSSSTVILGEVA